MPTFIRVSDRDTGHEYDVDERSFDPASHLKVNRPAQYPDLSGPGARPRPMKAHTTKAGQPVRNEEES